MTYRKTMTAADWMRLVALSVLWGGGFFFAQIAIAEVPALTGALGRVAFAAVALAALVRATGGAFPATLRGWLAIAALAVMSNVIPFTFTMWGQTYIPSALASILNATTPLFAVLVAHVATADEKLTPARLLGVVVGIGGVALMFGPGLLRDLGGEVFAELAVLGAALSYACSAIYARRFRGMSPISLSATQLITSTIMLTPLVLLIDHPWTLPPPSALTVGAILALSLLSTALAYVLYFRVLAAAGATNTLLVTFLSPVSAILLGTFVLGERLLPRHLAGMLVIFVGLAIIDGRAPRYLAGLLRPRTEVS